MMPTFGNGFVQCCNQILRIIPRIVVTVSGDVAIIVDDNEWVNTIFSRKRKNVFHICVGQ